MTLDEDFSTGWQAGQSNHDSIAALADKAFEQILEESANVEFRTGLIKLIDEQHYAVVRRPHSYVRGTNFLNNFRERIGNCNTDVGLVAFLVGRRLIRDTCNLKPLQKAPNSQGSILKIHAPGKGSI